MIEATRNLVEARRRSAARAPRCACATSSPGKRVALILSGGNASPEQLRELFG